MSLEAYLETASSAKAGSCFAVIPLSSL